MVLVGWGVGRVRNRQGGEVVELGLGGGLGVRELELGSLDVGAWLRDFGLEVRGATSRRRKSVSDAEGWRCRRHARRMEMGAQGGRGGAS